MTVTELILLKLSVQNSFSTIIVFEIDMRTHDAAKNFNNKLQGFLYKTTSWVSVS